MAKNKKNETSSPMDIFTSAVDQAASADPSEVLAYKEEADARADAAAINATAPQTEMERWRANIDLVKARADQQQAARDASVYTQPVDTGMPVRNNTPLGGQIWEGQANYSEGSRPRIVRLGNGQMMAEIGGVWSFVKDEKEAAFIMGVDRDQADIQLKRQDYRIKEDKLQASLDTMETTTATYHAFNRKLLTDMASQLANDSPEMGEMLRGFLEDEGSMGPLYAMEPKEFMNAVNQILDLMRSGADPATVSSALKRSQSKGSRAGNAGRAQYVNDLDDYITEMGNAQNTARKRVEELEEQKTLYMQRLLEPNEFGKVFISFEDANRAASAMFDPKIDAAKKDLNDRRDDWSRGVNKRDVQASTIAAQFDDSYGDNNIDNIYNDKTQSRRLMEIGGTVWGIMDLVARDSGFQMGLHSEDLPTQLADPEQAAMFIRECQRKAGSFYWQSNRADAWVNGLARWLINGATPSELAGIISAANEMDRNANFESMETGGSTAGQAAGPPAGTQPVSQQAGQMGTAVPGTPEEHEAFLNNPPPMEDMDAYGNWQQQVAALMESRGASQEEIEAYLLEQTTRQLTEE
tara:strand:- start:353 stop:2092 length:1740 start_codon:yes stop_codon:yes gene_type:complete